MDERETTLRLVKILRLLWAAGFLVAVMQPKKLPQLRRAAWSMDAGHMDVLDSWAMVSHI